MAKDFTPDDVLETWEDLSHNEKLLTSLDGLRDYLGREQKGRIQTVNLQHVFVASQTEQNHEDLRAATAVTADGWPLQWYAQSITEQSVERVTGRQALDLLLAGDIHHDRVATIGGSPEAIDSLEAALHSLGKTLVYRNEGLVTESDFEFVVEDLAYSHPNLVLTALGSPKGERLGALIHEQEHIQALIIGVGGAIEMWHGSTPGAPVWAQNLRCEWLYRLVKEPRRLFRRYVVECAPIMGTMYKRVRFARLKQK